MRRGWALTAALAASTAFADGPELVREGAVAYVCGGVGADERRTMNALEAEANLRLLFVTAKRGGYLAGAELTVSDGKQVRFSTVADGPICLLRVPAGRYRITAVIGGVTRAAQVAVGPDSGKPQRIVFAVPGEPWDGIWASPEEKSQAQE